MPDTSPQTDPITALADEVRQLVAALNGAAIQPEGLSPTEAARYIGVSAAKLHSMNTAGQLPTPVELGDGRCPRYIRSELAAWLRAGAPTRAQWAIRRETSFRRSA